MRGYKYHFKLNDAGNVATLRPTFGTYAKAYLPSLIVSLACWVWLNAVVQNANDFVNLDFTEADPDE